MTVLAAAVLVTGVAIAVPALAVNQNWWFLTPGAPKPQSAVEVVTSGRTAGINWTLTAYLSRDKGVCVAQTLEAGKGDMGEMACGYELRGEPALGSGERRGRHWVGYGQSSLGLYDFPDFVDGPVAKGVARVDLVLTNGQTLQTTPLEGPNDLPVNFYVVPLPRGARLEAVIARDRMGDVLERRTCPLCMHPPWRSSKTDS